jgi:activating signal cointegrator complex subunit 2
MGKYVGGRDPEKVLGALLEGAAMSLEELEHDLREEERERLKYGDGVDGAGGDDAECRVEQRRNAIEDEQADLARHRVGKNDTGFVFLSVSIPAETQFVEFTEIVRGRRIPTRS